MMKAFLNGESDTFYLVMGVFDHFFLLEFTWGSKKNLKSHGTVDLVNDVVVNMLDSSNISITDILNQTKTQVSPVTSSDEI
jgi:hypothetical protein